MKKIIIISLALSIFIAALSVFTAFLHPLERTSAENSPEAETNNAPQEILPDIIQIPHLGAVIGSEDSAVIRVLDGEALLEMTMGEYLVGVVAAEMPVSFEPEAIAAQAVAARTYALYKMRVAPSATHTHADVCTDFTDCAAFKAEAALREQWGADYEAYIAKIQNAVRVTDGVYLTYAAEPILAAFHSSSHGFTEDAERVWRRALPYLVSVPSYETADEVPNLISEVRLSLTEFRSVVASSFPSAKLSNETATWVTDITHTDSRRIDTLKIGGLEVTGIALRAAFELRSAAIEIAIGDEVVFTTSGYGHGVGMSQYGANWMAKRGTTWREILAAYYSGVSFSDEGGAVEQLQTHG